VANLRAVDVSHTGFHGGDQERYVVARLENRWRVVAVDHLGTFCF
jgi:hypothetical protein